jgi:hypothetical protein
MYSLCPRFQLLEIMFEVLNYFLLFFKSTCPNFWILQIKCPVKSFKSQEVEYKAEKKAYPK